MDRRHDETFIDAANDVPLSPLSFLHRAADVAGDDTGLITDASERVSWARMLDRARRLAGGLAELGLGAGDRVAVLAPNDLPLLEAHYGVPGAGCALVALNTRLSPPEYETVLRLADAKALIVDHSLAGQVAEIAGRLPALRAVVTIGPDGTADPGGYEDWLRTARPVPLRLPRDERRPLAVNFTSGTTGGPKGVVYTHRGGYLNALGQVVSAGLRADSRYLWTLPMFHCNGWCYTWAVTAAGARHIALRKVDPERVLDLVERERVTHLCGAPVVLDSLVAQSHRRRGGRLTWTSASPGRRSPSATRCSSSWTDTGTSTATSTGARTPRTASGASTARSATAAGSRCPGRSSSAAAAARPPTSSSCGTRWPTPASPGPRWGPAWSPRR
ncbi:acetyl-CoA synthetase [Actinomadura verrucosospora]|uniref:Acetyl-CoA synthetase n=1 Tax=Actinomadura verrucosospora TaxID=46165 RepID=A0A7D3ZT42_ACTVE|nr:acetyl-CoA synthetase [Actinomadura verrucosospora]